MVEGIVKSIQAAQESMTPGRIFVSSGELLQASINRSPSAYMNNPKEEILSYHYDTDKTMTLVKFVAEDGTDLGMVNWFAVHPTSMNNTNTLVSGDNKGYASQLFEKAMNPNDLPGQGKFVGAFAQSNCGDVSPNIRGPHCMDTGLPCDLPTSTCDGRVQMCVASGPGSNMQESTRIIGERQFEMAWNLYHDSDLEEISGPVKVAQQFVDMSNYTVTLKNGSTGHTCPPALGYSFAAGTVDGPGAFNFSQGMTEGNDFWNSIINIIHEPEPEQVECHSPKPILLDTGHFNIPYPWHPRIMDTQVASIGQLVIIAVPGEFTTMAGRRLRNKVAESLANEGMDDVIPVIAGLSNVYSHYIATWEEYQIQRYEGASTIFGPYTHEAYLEQYATLSKALATGEEISRGPDPPNFLEDVISLLPDVIYDAPPFGRDFGDVLTQPNGSTYVGETVHATFVAGHPRNDVQLGGSFLTVERLVDKNKWEVVATDAGWNTRFVWHRTSFLLGHSEANVYWDIPDETLPGTYRISHTGHYKSLTTGINPYYGVTDNFEVMAFSSDEKAPDSSERNHSLLKNFFWFLKLL